MPQLARPIGVVLGGGGFKGAVHVGFLEPLLRRGIPIDVVCGVSVGALNGALVAQGDFDLLWRLWDSIEAAGPRAIFDYWPLYQQPFRRSLCSSKGLKDLLLSHVNPDKIRNSSIKLHFCATCLEDGQLRYFDNASDHLLDGLLASCAMPIFFEPVVIEGKHYVDGGVICNVPVQKAIEESCNTVFVFMTGPKEPKTFVSSRSRFRVARRSLELLMHSRDTADMKIADLLVERVGGLLGS